MTCSLAKLELTRTTWTDVREAAGPASSVPNAIRELLAAATPDDVHAPYWQLENHIVLQGQLFAAAAFVVPVLMAALVEHRPRHVRIAVLDLLLQIRSGEPHVDEVKRGNGDLSERCWARAREGLWILYRELISGETDAARDVLELIETDKNRLIAFLDRACSP